MSSIFSRWTGWHVPSPPGVIRSPRLPWVPALLLLLLLPVGPAQADEFTCTAERPGESRILLEWGDLVLEESYYAGGCHLRVVHSFRDAPSQFRDYSFSEAGEIYIYSEFDNPNNPNSTFATSGTHSYFLFPRVTYLKAVFHEAENEFYIRLPSGEQIHFLNHPLRIDEQRTRGLEVVQRQVTHGNAGGITLHRPRGVMLSAGYRPGGTERVRSNLLLEDHQGNRCQAANTAMFDYYRNAYRITQGTCPAFLRGGCQCLDPGTSKERTVCESRMAMKGAGQTGGALDGYLPKPEIESIIKHSCPRLADALELARADRNYWLEDLSPRFGMAAPPFRPQAEPEQVASQGFDLVEGLRSLFGFNNEG